MPLLCCLCPPIPTMGELYCQQISSLSTLSACFYCSNIFSPVDATSMTLVLVILTSVVLLVYCFILLELYIFVFPFQKFSPGSNGRMTTMGVYVRDLLLGQVSFLQACFSFQMLWHVNNSTLSLPPSPFLKRKGFFGLLYLISHDKLDMIYGLLSAGSVIRIIIEVGKVQENKNKTAYPLPRLNSSYFCFQNLGLI